MDAKNLTAGLIQNWMTCIPDSFETFGKCIGKTSVVDITDVDIYALQTVSLGRMVKFKAVGQLSSPSNSNGSFVDTSTLLGQLSAGIVDWVLDCLVMTEKRVKYITYGTQHSEDSICFLISRRWISSANQSNSTYFMTVFNKRIVQFFAVILAFYMIIKVAVGIMSKNIESLFPWFRKASFGLANICFVLFYNNNLKASFMPSTTLVLPFRTVKELTELVKTNNYHLVIDNVDDYRMEMINNSQNTAVRALKRVLYSKIVKTEGPELWNKLHRVRGAFTMTGWNDFISMDQRKVQDVVPICPNALPKLAAAYGFPKKSKMVNVFNQRAHFIYALQLYVIRSMEGWRTYYYSQRARVHSGFHQLDIVTLDILFMVYLALLIISMLICVCEAVYAKQIKSTSRTQSASDCR